VSADALSGIRFRIIRDYPFVNVGSFPPSDTPEGVADMCGFLAQWCSDAYSADYYRTSPEVDPKGPAVPPGQERTAPRVLRGGVAAAAGWAGYTGTPAWVRIGSLYHMAHVPGRGWVSESRLAAEELALTEPERAADLLAAEDGPPSNVIGGVVTVKIYRADLEVEAAMLKARTAGFRVVLEAESNAD
jgi:hypothetical protein